MFRRRGLFHRLFVAHRSFLNPEEALSAQFTAHAPVGVLFHHGILNTHPPVQFLLLRLAQAINYRSELLMRLPMVLAGTLFAVVVYLWLKRISGITAAWIALFVLLMSQNMFFLSTQVRGYALMMFFLAAAIYAIDRAFLDDSPAWAAVSALLLALAISSEYAAFFVAVGVGLYCLATFRWIGASRRLRAWWLACQIALMGYCVWLELLRRSLSRRGGGGSLGAGWMLPHIRDQVFGPQTTLPGFLATQTTQLFGYLFSSNAAGLAALVVFGVGVAMLVRAGGRQRLRAVLLASPLVIGALAGLARAYPYGGTRHSSELMVIIATGVALGLAPLFRRRLVALWLVCLVAAPVMYFRGTADGGAMPRLHMLRQPLYDALAFLKAQAPGALVLTDSESRDMISYYLEPDRRWPRGIHSRQEEEVGGFTLYSNRRTYTSFDELHEDAAAMREAYHLSPDVPIWVFETGFHCTVCVDWTHDPSLRDGLLVARQFGLGAAVLELPPGFGSQVTESSPVNRPRDPIE